MIVSYLNVSCEWTINQMRIGFDLIPETRSQIVSALISGLECGSDST